MKKTNWKIGRTLTLVLLLFPLGCAEKADTDNSSNTLDVISNSESLVLTEKAYREQLAAENREKIRQLANGNSDRIIDWVLDIHSTADLAVKAENQKLHRDPLVTARIKESRQNILATAYLQKIRADVKFPDLEELAKERYTHRKADLKTPEQRKLAHILLRDKQDCPCDTTPPASERAEDIRKQLIDGTATFAELAETMSTDYASAKNGGVLPTWIERNGQTVSAFEDAAFELTEVGDISPPIRSQFGVHIIKLIDLRPSRQLAYEDIADQLISQLKVEMVNSALEKARSAAYPNPDSIDVETLRLLIQEYEKNLDQK